MSTAPNKETIYIDIDDEITAIIEKVISSDSKIVALVLPKRATTLQSIVNMKLLKRSADESKKHLVLVTNEPSLLPLAGAVGLHVAKTPQSKPEVPAEPKDYSGDVESVDESTEPSDDFDAKRNAALAIGTLAGTSNDDEGPIEFDNEEAAPTAAAAPLSEKAKNAPAKGKNSKLKVPSFTKFRKRLLIAGSLAVLLIVGFIYALIAMPNATIAISTNTEDVNQTLDVTFDAAADGVNAEEAIVPSIVERLERSNSETVAASGERNDGERAEGSVRMTICASSSDEVNDVPAGTGVSHSGNNYITQETARFSFAFSGCDDGGFKYDSQSVKIIAQEGGLAYNVSKVDFTVAGSSATAQGSAKGGTDDIIKVVSQEDVDSANQKLDAKVDESARAELSRRLEDRGLYVIEKSFNVGEPESNVSVPVGSESDEVTVTRKTIYTMIGVEREELESLIKQSVAAEIDPEKQSILSTGLDEAVFELQNEQNNGARIVMSMDFTSVAGPDLNDESIKTSVAGKKSAEAESIISQNPGVTDVEVTYGPFWVSSIPKNIDKITINYSK